MCDTVVATGSVTADGWIHFGKNSDREVNEAHHLWAVPASDYPAGSEVQCTYIAIPQVAHTYAVLLAKPFSIWGAEIGTNEHGVTIGNEAVFTRAPMSKRPLLTGMDLLRLGLERGATAREALQVITDLLAKHGQGGNCGFTHDFRYHNSFILADAQEAWVLETADRQWAAKQIHGVYTISNGLTLGTEWDLASPDLVSYAISRGWCKGASDFDFARCYSDFFYTTMSACRYRCQRTTALLAAQSGRITAVTLMQALRDHDGAVPADGLAGATVCMHASLGPARNSQTTGSMVSHLHPQTPTHFVTGTAAPCTSLFKPLWLDALPVFGPVPNGRYNPDTLFWQHERLHRATLQDYQHRLSLYQKERDQLEEAWAVQALAAAPQTAVERAALSQRCWDTASQSEANWWRQISQEPVQKAPNWLYRTAWQAFNKQASMPE